MIHSNPLGTSLQHPFQPPSPYFLILFLPTGSSSFLFLCPLFGPFPVPFPLPLPFSYSLFIKSVIFLALEDVWHNGRLFYIQLTHTQMRREQRRPQDRMVMRSEQGEHRQAPLDGLLLRHPRLHWHSCKCHYLHTWANQGSVNLMDHWAPTYYEMYPKKRPLSLTYHEGRLAPISVVNGHIWGRSNY